MTSMVIIFHLKIDSAPKIDDNSHFSIILALLTLLLNLKDNSKCLSNQNWLVNTGLDITWATHEKAVFSHYYTWEFTLYFHKDITPLFSFHYIGLNSQSQVWMYSGVTFCPQAFLWRMESLWSFCVRCYFSNIPGFKKFQIFCVSLTMLIHYPYK